ncbi:hypothetical protein GCM10025870_27620 [Agromyces marinus]|uniref:2-C-methyl-D-erythritol 4-phosphate cytidylyltransferase n=1 Tax=Agromyces marinus TaxID=1389020 RepID=A0ABM8H4G6_9MICO|nr:hypothetical protein GCM10025870_27620 [Agromyces marinus]
MLRRSSAAPPTAAAAYGGHVNDTTVAVIVVAAGSGTRLGHPEPKALVPLGDDTVLGVALDAVLGMREAPFVVVVAPTDRLEDVRARSAARAAAASVDLVVVAGGSTRQESVSRGLAELPRAIEVVLVHDAARPLAPAAVFDEVAAAVAARGRGIVPGLPVVDTVKRVDGEGHVLETVDRSELAAMQTPQGFPREVLESAYQGAGADFTDDAALVASAGVAVDVVPGDARAFKITVPSDLHRAEHLLAERVASAAPDPAAHRAHPAHAAVPRVGTGIDVHAFADDGDAPLWLAGLHWPGSARSRGTATATRSRTRSATRCWPRPVSATSAACSAPPIRGSRARTARSSSPRPCGDSRLPDGASATCRSRSSATGPSWRPAAPRRRPCWPESSARR